MCTGKIPHSKPYLDTNDINSVIEVIRSGHLAEGEIVAKFETQISHYIGQKDGVATNSGTSALHLSLIAFNIKKGDEVIVPSYVCTALLNVIKYLEAIPVIVDVNLEDFNINVQDIERKITSKTKVIIVPHMFGLAANIHEILEFEIPIIEDCAQSIGAEYCDKKVGSFGDLSIFSFYATKMICTGEGGMVLSNSKDLIEKIRDLHNYDFKNDYKVRYNYKLTDLQAALGISQLNHLPHFIDKRQGIAKIYNEELKGSNLILPVHSSEKKHIFYRYVVLTDNCKNIEPIFHKLRIKGVTCTKPVDIPLHRICNFSSKNYPNTEMLFNNAISIPIYPMLNDEEITHIVNVIKDVFN